MDAKSTDKMKKFMNNLIDISNRLRKLRDLRDISQPEMAEALNTPLPSYRSYEQGKRVIPVEFASKVTKEFNTTYNYLFQGEEDAPFNMIMEVVFWTRQLEVKHDITFSPEGFSKFVESTCKYLAAKQREDKDFSEDSMKDAVTELFKLKAA